MALEIDFARLLQNYFTQLKRLPEMLRSAVPFGQILLLGTKSISKWLRGVVSSLIESILEKALLSYPGNSVDFILT